ncbi:MAG: metal-dependent transcriptional regulator [Clostridia bacterium]|nr:metal-dependent transcriptional regulator [Clostridia bacterium]
MKIQESAENYLETIYVLSLEKGSVRSIDIANELGFSKPSVSVAMKNLREKEMIEMNKDGYITLLKKGEQIAKKVYERHTILTDCLVKIGVEREIASEDACKIEHFISDETFEALKNFIK